MSDVPPDLAYLHWLITECGYQNVRPIGESRWAATIPRIFTHAIVVGKIGDRCGIDSHWCYATRADAIAALDAWDGHGEPVGWIRHPASGRRVSQTGDEIDQHGNKVGAAGVLYVRS